MILIHLKPDLKIKMRILIKSSFKTKLLNSKSGNITLITAK